MHPAHDEGVRQSDTGRLPSRRADEVVDPGGDRRARDRARGVRRGWRKHGRAVERGAVEPAPASLAPASPSPSAEASPSAANAIVGEWVGVHDCERIVAMLGDAGLDEFLGDAVYGNELIPGVDPSTATLKDPSKPCDGAVERQHSHFFTAAGEFGSKDFRGQRVDDGTYTLEGEDGLVINGSALQVRGQRR